MTRRLGPKRLCVESRDNKVKLIGFCFASSHNEKVQGFVTVRRHCNNLKPPKDQQCQLTLCKQASLPGNGKVKWGIEAY